MTQKKRRLAALLLCACLMLVFFLSGALYSSHDGHDCHGSHCEVCAQISRIGDLLRQLKAALFFAAAASALSLYALLLFIMPKRAMLLKTPVSLRVQMNN
jgi:hypothetical protein